MHCGYVIKVEKLRPHSNADRMQLLDIFGTTTCVGLDTKVGDIGVYFPSGLQLSLEFCLENHLLRKKPDGTPDTGYMDPNKRNITTIRLRGEPSDGLYVPAAAFTYLGINLGEENIGTTIDIVNGNEICCKYIPRTNPHTPRDPNQKNKKKKKINIAPLFMEHVDTEQLAYNLKAFRPEDQIEITLKMHGTSQRTGYLPVIKKYKRSLLDRILRREGTPIYEWGYVSGTRRIVLEDYEGGYYGNNHFREQHSKFFEGKLHKGETVYYEVVGFIDTGAPIMGMVNNKKLNDKEFVKKYGESTVFSYDCEPLGYRPQYGYDENGPFQIDNDWPQSAAYVYRMTMTNEDGDVVEYTPDYMRYRCEQMGAKCVPVFWKGYIPDEDHLPQVFDIETGADHRMTAGEWIQEKAEEFYDGPDPVGKTHVREGVVARIVNRPTFTAYKHKNYSFKMLTGVILEQVADNINSITDEDILTEL